MKGLGGRIAHWLGLAQKGERRAAREAAARVQRVSLGRDIAGRDGRTAPAKARGGSPSPQLAGWAAEKAAQAAERRAALAACRQADVGDDAGDDDDPKELTGKSSIAQARRAEQARCAAIILSPAGQANPRYAIALATETKVDAGEALRLLRAEATAAE